MSSNGGKQFTEEELWQHQDLKIHRKNLISAGAAWMGGPVNLKEQLMDEELEYRAVRDPYNDLPSMLVSRRVLTLPAGR